MLNEKPLSRFLFYIFPENIMSKIDKGGYQPRVLGSYDYSLEKS